MPTASYVLILKFILVTLAYASLVVSILTALYALVKFLQVVRVQLWNGPRPSFILPWSVLLLITIWWLALTAAFALQSWFVL